MSASTSGDGFRLWAGTDTVGDFARVVGDIDDRRGIFALATWCSDHLMWHVHADDGRPTCTDHAEPTLHDVIAWTVSQVRGRVSV